MCADLLHPAGPAHAAAAAAPLHDVDVAALAGAGDKADAGLVVVVLHRLR